MSHPITLSPYLFIVIVLAGLAGGAYIGSSLTAQSYESQQEQILTKESDNDRENLLCEARVQRGQTGDVKSEYFVFERSLEQEDCERFIQYTNLPEDTEMFWLGF